MIRNLSVSITGDFDSSSLGRIGLFRSWIEVFLNNGSGLGKSFRVVYELKGHRDVLASS